MNYYGKVILRSSNYLRFINYDVYQKKSNVLKDTQVTESHKRTLGVVASSVLFRHCLG